MGNCIFLRRGAPPSSAPPKPGKLLNEYTWEEISYISSNGLTEEFGFQAGDAKEIVLNGTVGILNLSNFTTYAYIIGINHNAAVEGNNLIHFQVGKSALTGGVDIAFVDSEYDYTGSSTAFRINTSGTNEGGWKESFMRNNICGTSLTDYPATSFLAVLPDDLRAVLRPVTKYTDNIGGGDSISSNVTGTIDYVFLPSEYEVCGDVYRGNTYEANYQQRYSYYANQSAPTKYSYIDTLLNRFYFTRSPGVLNESRWVRLSTSWRAANTSANSSYGFAPCFCV